MRRRTFCVVLHATGRLQAAEEGNPQTKCRAKIPEFSLSSCSGQRTTGVGDTHIAVLFGRLALL